jgi:hypothetical protein
MPRPHVSSRGWARPAPRTELEVGTVAALEISDGPIDDATAEVLVEQIVARRLADLRERSARAGALPVLVIVPVVVAFPERLA